MDVYINVLTIFSKNQTLMTELMLNFQLNNQSLLELGRFQFMNINHCCYLEFI